MLPVKKIYLDSHFKTNDSVSNSDCKFLLRETFTFPENTIMFLDDVAIPHSWYSVISGINDKLYFIITYDGNTTGFIATITSQNYTGSELATEIANQMNAEYTTLTDNFAAAFNVLKQTITITSVEGTLTFRILTETEIESDLNGTYSFPTYTASNPADINGKVLKQTGNTSVGVTSFTSGFIDLQPIKNIYIYCSNLSTFTTVSPDGGSGVIKKVPVTQDTGYYIFDNVMNNNDYVDVSRLSIRTLHFQLKDKLGNVIPLNGSTWSASIVFAKNNNEN